VKSGTCQRRERRTRVEETWSRTYLSCEDDSKSHCRKGRTNESARVERRAADSRCLCCRTTDKSDSVSREDPVLPSLPSRYCIRINGTRVSSPSPLRPLLPFLHLDQSLPLSRSEVPSIPNSPYEPRPTGKPSPPHPPSHE